MPRILKPETESKPPCSNRGVHTPKINLSIDYLSLTFPTHGTDKSNLVHMTACQIMGLRNEIIEVIKPRKGFTAAVKLQIGRLDVNDSDHSPFAAFEFKGQDMQDFRRAGGKENEILKRLLENQGRASRVDLALDIKDDPRVSISELEASYRAGEIATRAKAARLVEDMATGGKTLYIGSRTSNSMVRFYDKAIQSGNLTELWMRMELEVKNQHAQRLISQIAGKGLQDSARFWFSKYKFKLDWYLEILESMHLTRPPSDERNEGDKLWWLRFQVLPALRKLPHNEPKTLKWFITQVNQEFGNGAKGGCHSRLKIRKLI